jgi:predicted amidohydrolase YtcJ
MMTVRKAFAAGIALVMSCSLNATSPAPGSVIYEAAKIITMDPQHPTARYVAVGGRTIVAVGDNVEDVNSILKANGFLPPRDVDRQFANDVLMPGLIDPHIHPMQAAVMLNIPFLAPDDWDLPGHNYKGVRSESAYRKALRRQIADSQEPLFISWGYHELFHGRLDRAVLDSIAPDRAVVIWQRSFHEVIMNSTALKMLGLEDQSQVAPLMTAVHADPAHLDLARGIFSETALQVALGKLRPFILTPARIKAGMATLQRILLSKGITTVADMATGIFADFDTEATLIRSAFERGDNPSRVLLMPIASATPADALTWLSSKQARYGGDDHVLLKHQVKMFADGAFFAQNMQMNAPGYSDGHVGKWLTEPALLSQQFGSFWAQGFSLHVHVNGDKGLDVVLDGLAPLAKQEGQTITLEHLGYSTEAQNARIAAMGLLVSAQPNYIRVLGDAYAKHGLGAKRADQMNRLGSLERKGVPIGLHSDFNMAPIDPLYLAWIASNRVTLSGKMKAPEERLSLDKALRAITSDAARVIGLEGIIVGAAGLRDIRVKGVVYEGRPASAPAR